MSAHQLIDQAARIIAQSFQLARTRLADKASSVMTWTLTRSRLVRRIHFLERQVEVFKEQRQRMDSQRKPRYSPDLRREILTIGALQEWNNCEIARQFVLTEGAIRRWKRRIANDEDPDRLLGCPPWNKHHAIVDWLIRDLKDQLPDLSVRRIAMHIRRAGVATSKSDVHRKLKLAKPRKPRPPMSQPEGIAPFRIIAPRAINKTWHLDLTTFKRVFRWWTVAAIIDG